MNGRTTLRLSLVRRALATAAVVLAGALMLAGCGSGSSSSTGSAETAATASATSTSTSAKLSAFETCLKQHGVKVNPKAFSSARPHASFTPTAFPTGSPRPHPSFTGSFAGGRDSAAFKACEKYAPSGFGRGFGRTISSSALAAFKSCLGQNGITVTGKTASAVLAEVRSLTGKKAAAVQTCRVLLQPTAPTPSPST